MDVHVLLAPVDCTNCEVYGVEWVDNVIDREVALVVEARAIRVLVQFIEMLTQGEVSGVRHGDLVVLVDIGARQRLDVIAQNMLHVCDSICELLGTVGIEVAHQSRAVAIAIAIRNRCSKFDPLAIAERRAITDDIHFQFTGRTVQVDAHGCVVVVVRNLCTAECVRNEIVVGADDEVVGAICDIGHIDPLAAQA